MPWVFITDKLHENEKIIGASGDVVKLWLLSLSWANDMLTDGHIPPSRAPMLAGWAPGRPRDVITGIVRARLWHHADRPCRTCVAQREEKKADPLPAEGYVIHHYFDYQRPRWVVVADRERMRRLGSAGGYAKAARDASGTPQRDAMAPGHSDTPYRDAIAPRHGATPQRSAMARTPVAPVPDANSIRTPVPGAQTPDPATPTTPAGTGSNDPGATGLTHIGVAMRRGRR